MRLVRLTARTIRRLNDIERTPNAEPWVEEVERFVLDGGAASHRFEPQSSVLLADENGRSSAQRYTIRLMGTPKPNTSAPSPSTIGFGAAAMGDFFLMP
jgi:hypothetical protein